MYETLKALHVASVAAWVGGMALAAAVAPRVDAAGATLVRRAYARLVTPAMVAALALGLAVEAGWFRATWLQAKLLPVVLLTALHGALSGRLRRLSVAGGTPGSGRAAWLPAAVLGLLILAAWLAVAKPGAAP